MLRTPISGILLLIIDGYTDVFLQTYPEYSAVVESPIMEQKPL